MVGTVVQVSGEGSVLPVHCAYSQAFLYDPPLLQLKVTDASPAVALKFGLVGVAAFTVMLKLITIVAQRNSVASSLSSSVAVYVACVARRGAW